MEAKQFNPDGVTRRTFISGSFTALGALAVGGPRLVQLLDPVRGEAATQSGLITTMAGGGAVGDGHVGTAANLSTPFSASVDMAGNLYIADLYFHRIRRVDSQTQVISTVAGSARSGYSGDGGLAVNAALFMPYGVVPDQLGNLYIADNGNSCVRQVDRTGIITSFVGTGRPGYNGDGRAASTAQLFSPRGVALDHAGNLYIADTLNARIRIVNRGTQAVVLYPASPHPVVVPPGQIATVAGNGTVGGGGDGGAALQAQFCLPTALAFDSHGHLYVADLYNNRIRKVDAQTGLISTVAGTGAMGSSGDGGVAHQATLALPSGVALDSADNLYIAQQGAARIRKVDAGTQVITTVAGGPFFAFHGDGGPATRAGLNGPTGVALDAHGALYIADQYNARVRRVDMATTVITTVAGSSRVGDFAAATAAVLVEPAGTAFDAVGNLFIADQGDHRIRVVGVHGVIATVAGVGVAGYGGDGGGARYARLNAPCDVTVDAGGNLFIADLGNERIRRVDATTGVITTVVGIGWPGYGGDHGPATAALLREPRAIALDRHGGMYIADLGNMRVRFVNLAAQPITLYAGSPNALTVGPGQIITVVGTGIVGSSGDGGPGVHATLTSPRGVTVDQWGHLYVTEGSFDVQGADLTLPDSRVRKVDSQTGLIDTIAGTSSAGYNGDNIVAQDAQLNGPRGVVVDGAGNLFIADTYNQRVRFVNTGTQPVTLFSTSSAPLTVAGGDITTVVGTGVVGYSGDGGPGPSATMLYPRYVALDPAGNLYITDAGNSRIRRLAVQ